MAGPEARLRTRIIKKLTAYGGFWWVNHQTQYGRAGVSDISGVYQGFHYALEVKMPGKEHTLTDNQARFLKKIRDAGGKAHVVSSVDEAMDFVFGGSP